MAIERIYYATHNVSVNSLTLKGVQSVSLTSSTGFDPVFQLGQCEPIDFTQGVPDVEVTITRSLSGASLLNGLQLANASCSVAETFLDNEKNIVIASESGGFTINKAVLSGYSVNFTTDGVFTEEITYIANELVAGGGSFAPSNDSDLHLPVRQDFSGIAGATSVRLSITLNREPVFKLGQFLPIKRFLQFPIETTMEISYLLAEGGSPPAQPSQCVATPAGTENFSVVACDSTYSITGARLTNIGYSGGDTGGGNVEHTYTYTSYNNVSIT